MGLKSLSKPAAFSASLSHITTQALHYGERNVKIGYLLLVPFITMICQKKNIIRVSSPSELVSEKKAN